MNEIKSEIDSRIKGMHLATPAHNALAKATCEIYNQIQEKKILGGASPSHLIATAAFLACDGNACIAIPKLKHAFGSRIKGGYISKSRAALQIPRGTAHQKLDSLCKVLDVSDPNLIKLAPFYASVLDGTSHMPSYLAVASLYLASNMLYIRNRLTLKELHHYTGCGEISIRETWRSICQKVAGEEFQQRHKNLLKSIRSSNLGVIK